MLPTVDQLHSLLDGSCSDVAVNTEVFPDVAPTGEGDATYWTTSPMGVLNLTYTVDLISGVVDGHSAGLGYEVRLVRRP